MVLARNNNEKVPWFDDLGKMSKCIITIKINEKKRKLQIMAAFL